MRFLEILILSESLDLDLLAMDDLANFSLCTPALVYSEIKIIEVLKLLRNFFNQSALSILFPLKSCSFKDIILLIEPYVDGFSASSVFEARIAREILGKKKSVHLTSPSIRHDEINQLSETCDYIAFNSIAQFDRYNCEIDGRASSGLRINPQLSFVKDERYDPCRKHSKLGVPLDLMADVSWHKSDYDRNLQGILFHSNCESNNFSELQQTIKKLYTRLPKIFEQISWVNFGGGYVFETEQDLEKLHDCVTFVKDRCNAKVFFEPGKGIIGQAGSIVSTVVDIFTNDSHSIAVLDTTTNHMPEVFEYQYKPDVAQESEEGKYSYLLAGASCLSGDVFGEYRFDKPLEIGSRIVFENMGAYTLVKANMFNGINLPTIYAYTQDGKLELKRQFTYDDFLSRCGGR